MNVQFFALAKRPNSTARPNLSGGSTYTDVQLKGPCSIRHPSIVLRLSAGSDPVGFNYCYIAAFERYYFVNDWINEGFNWSAELVEDELATFKDAIGASTQYILRSSHSSDGDIIDKLYPATAETTLSRTWGSPPAWSSPTGGWYVIGIQNIDNNAQAMGSSRYYALTTDGMNALMESLFGSAIETIVQGQSQPGWTGFQDMMSNITDEVFKSLFNPIEYITSCMFLPVQPNIDGNNLLTSLNYGYWILPNLRNCYRVDLTSATTKSGSFTIPRHPLAATRGKYLTAAPFTRYTLTFQPFGQLVVDPAKLYNSDDDKLYYNVCIDPVSGIGTLKLSIIANNVTQDIYTQTAQIGVPVNIAQMSRDFIGFATSSLGAAGGAASSYAMGNIPGIFGSVASGIASAMESMLPQIQTQGSNGSFVSYYPENQEYLTAEFIYPVDEDNADLGRPLCKKGIISNYPGYLMIMNPDVSINEATREEMEAIQAYMVSGFFYE